MYGRSIAFLVASAVLSGCATITPPPDRVYWDEVPVSTECTESRLGVDVQYAGSIGAAVLGGWYIGAGLAATGIFPIFGIPLAGIGILGGADADEKYKQVEKCNDFKRYVLIKRSGEEGGVTSGEEDVRVRLQEIDRLYDEGVITEDEYKKARENIISDM